MRQAYKVRSYHMVESSQYLDVRLWNRYHGNVLYFFEMHSCVSFGSTLAGHSKFKQLVFNWTYLSI